MKEFNEYIETNQWLKKLMDELSEEDGMRLENSFYDFKQHCIKAENLPISDVSDCAKKCNSNTSRCRGFAEPDSFCPQCEHYH